MPLTRLEKIYLVIWEKNWMLKISLIFFVIALSKSCKSILPKLLTLKYVTLNPIFSSDLHVFKTAGCSIELVIIWFPYL